MSALDYMNVAQLWHFADVDLASKKLQDTYRKSVANVCFPALSVTPMWGRERWMLGKLLFSCVFTFSTEDDYRVKKAFQQPAIPWNTYPMNTSHGLQYSLHIAFLWEQAAVQLSLFWQHINIVSMPEYRCTIKCMRALDRLSMCRAAGCVHHTCQIHLIRGRVCFRHCGEHSFT